MNSLPAAAADDNDYTEGHHSLPYEVFLYDYLSAQARFAHSMLYVLLLASGQTCRAIYS